MYTGLAIDHNCGGSEWPVAQEQNEHFSITPTPITPIIIEKVAQ